MVVEASLRWLKFFQGVRFFSCRLGFFVCGGGGGGEADKMSANYTLKRTTCTR